MVVSSSLKNNYFVKNISLHNSVTQTSLISLLEIGLVEGCMGFYTVCESLFIAFEVAKLSQTCQLLFVLSGI